MGPPQILDIADTREKLDLCTHTGLLGGATGAVPLIAAADAVGALN